MRKHLLFFCVILLISTMALISCSSKNNGTSSESDLTVIREFTATDSSSPGYHITIKQNGYGAFYDLKCYDQDGTLVHYRVFEHENNFVKESKSYNQNGNLMSRIVYEREPNGKLINMKLYTGNGNDELPAGQKYYKEENDSMAATDNATTIVRYDDLCRVIRIKDVRIDPLTQQISEELTITEYDEYGLKSEKTYIDGELVNHLELTLKK